MAYTGTFEAPKIQPSAFGLFDVVKPENAVDEDKWVRGFAQEWETTPQTVTNYDATDSTSKEISSSTVNYFDEIDPFFVEVDETLSTFSFKAIDRIARIERQLEGVTQKAVEAELWDGAIRQGESHENLALTSSNVTMLNSGTALSAKRALALLEHKIATTSPAGEQGVIHMTRDMAALLSSNSQMLFHEVGKDHLQTMGGTPVIIGSGYSGNGPRLQVATAAISGGNTLTINTSAAHALVTGDVVNLSIVGENIEETRTGVSVTKVDADTITITIAGLTNASSEAVTGYVQMVGVDSSKWMYASGLVKVYLGKTDVVNDNIAQGYDVSGNQNDLRLKAIRPAAVYFDSSVHLTVRVDLTA